MNSVEELVQAIEQALATIGATQLTAEVLRGQAADCLEEIAEEMAEVGTSPDSPFVNFVAFGNAAAYVFYADPFEVFIVGGEEVALINDYESADLAMSEVDAHRKLIEEKYGKVQADVSVARSVANEWMDAS